MRRGRRTGNWGRSPQNSGRSRGGSTQRVTSEEREEAAMIAEDLGTGPGPSRSRESSDGTAETSSNGPPTMFIPEKFFKFRGPADTPNNYKYECVRCGRMYSCNYKSRSKLKTHLQNKHTHCVEEFQRVCFEEATNEIGLLGTALAQHPSSSALGSSDSTNPSLAHFWGQRRMTQAELDSYILDYLIFEVEPLAKVDSPAFENFVKALVGRNHFVGPKALKIPCRQTITKRLEQKFGAKKQALKEVLKMAEQLCTTADAWSSHGRGYIGVTAHWLDKDTLKRKSACLGLRRLKGSHTHAVLARSMDAIHKEFHLEGKISETVTDNAANFAKAFTAFGEKPKNVPVVPTTSERAGNKGKPKERRTERERQMNLDQFLGDDLEEELDDVYFFPIEEILNGEVGTDQNEEEEEEGGGGHPGEFSGLDLEELEEEDTPELPRHFRCSAHTMNLVATADASKALQEPQKQTYDPRFSPHPSPQNITAFQTKFKRVTSKMRALWRKQRQSTKCADAIKEKLKCLFVVHNKTRWNSSYYAFASVYNAANTPEKLVQMNELCAELKLGENYFLKTDMEFLREYLEVFEPISIALDVLQGEGSEGSFHENLGAGYLIPTLRAVQEKLKPFCQDGKLTYCRPLALQVWNGFQKRFKAQMEDDRLMVAAVIHPRFRLGFLSDDEKPRAIQLVKDAAMELISEVGEEDDSPPDSSGTGASGGEKRQASPRMFGKGKRKDLFSGIMQQKEKRSKSSLAEKVEKEIEHFLAAEPNDDVSDFLPRVGQKAKPELNVLKDLYVKFNTCLPSSAAVERLFSLVGRVYGPLRTNMSDEHLEMEVFLHQNEKLFLVD